MSQSEVIQLLKNVYPKWFTVKEVAEQLKVIRNSISVNLSRLRRSSLINWRTRTNITSSRRPMFEYQYKNESERKKHN